MKNVIFTGIICLLFSNQIFSQVNEVYLFIDGTSSTNVSEAIRKHNAFSALEIIEANITNDGDKVHTAYLYENSSSAANLTTETVEFPSLNITSRDSQKAAEAKRITHQSNCEDVIYDLAMNKVDDIINAPSTGQESNIFSSLELVASHLNLSSKNIIVYCSDLLEESPYGNLKSLLSNTSLTPSQAKQAGIKYAKQVADTFQIKASDFESVDALYVILPASDFDGNTAFRNIRFFYSSFFTHFGLQPNFSR